MQRPAHRINYTPSILLLRDLQTNMEIKMNTKVIVTAILFSATNMAWASGGISIDNVEQHMNANNWIMTQAQRSEISIQGQTDKVVVAAPSLSESVADNDYEEDPYNDLGV